MARSLYNAVHYCREYYPKTAGTLFSRFGLPEQLVSDNGTQFISQEFQNFMKANGIHQITSAPYHPSTNGLSERSVQTMKQTLKSARGQHSIQERLDTFLLSYRNTPYAMTKASPAFLMMGRQLRTCFDLLKPSEPRQTVQHQQQYQVSRCAPRAKDRTFSSGEPVLAWNCTSGAKWVPATIITQTGPVSYTVRTAENLTWWQHVDQLLPGHVSPQDTSSVELSDFTSSGETPNQKSPVPDCSPPLLLVAEIPPCPEQADNTSSPVCATNPEPIVRPAPKVLLGATTPAVCRNLPRDRRPPQWLDL
ncbi:unnamed protein product [Caretta caretta]